MLVVHLDLLSWPQCSLWHLSILHLGQLALWWLLFLFLFRLLDKSPNRQWQQFLSSAIYANLIIQVEKIEFAPYKLKLPVNTLMFLLPSSSQSNGTLKYNTNIVKFHHSCYWKALSIINKTTDISLISIARQNWSTANLVLSGQNQTRAGILHDRKMGCLDNAIFSGSTIALLFPVDFNTIMNMLELGSHASLHNATDEINPIVY